jgi:O-antigen ligase
MISKSVKIGNINLGSIQFFFLCTIPYSLVFSIFVADFCMVLICFLFIAKNIIEKKNYFDNAFFKFFFIFWVYISARSLFSEDIYFSLKSSLLFIRVGIFAVAIKFLIEENPKRIYFLFIILASLLPIVAADAMLQFFTGKNIFGYSLVGFLPGRLSGFFDQELIIGSYVARMTPIMIGVYFYCKHLELIRQQWDYYLLIVLCFLFFLVLLSGERVSNLYYFISIFFFFLFSNITKLKKIITFLFVILLVIFLLTKSEVLKQRLIISTANQIGILNKDKPIYIYSIDHHHHILAAYEIFKENIFFGSGAKMFRIICDQRHKVSEHSCTTHPHNLIMQFLSETGIIGTFFYFLSLFYILIKLFKILRMAMCTLINNNDKTKFFFLVALLIGLFPILPSGNFFNNWISIISFLPVGLYISKIKKTF